MLKKFCEDCELLGSKCDGEDNSTCWTGCAGKKTWLDSGRVVRPKLDSAYASLGDGKVVKGGFYSGTYMYEVQFNKNGKGRMRLYRADELQKAAEPQLIR
jgi:hypothetical protein